jgi:hypothetical protein
MPDVPERTVGRPRTGSLLLPLSPVDAHGLLNSASVIMLGLSTLDDGWGALPDAERRDVLARVRRHADLLAAGLRELIQPERDPCRQPALDT